MTPELPLDPKSARLAEIFRRQESEIQTTGKIERSRQESELRARIAAGDSAPDLIVSLSKLLDDDSGIALLRERCAVSPHRELYLALTSRLWKSNRAEDAVVAADTALRHFPGDRLLQIRRALYLPILYETQSDVVQWRRQFASHLNELCDAFTLQTPAEKEQALDAIGSLNNFYLAYQAENDRDFQAQYAGLVHRIVAALFPNLVMPAQPPPLPPGGRIRLGYVSAHFGRHSVTKSHGGWILNHNRGDFEIFSYQIGGEPDPGAADVMKASDHFQRLSGDLASDCNAIRADRLHAVIFLDVGMKPRMTLLAATQLAALQCVTWGHPVTTGSPNIGYYLSSELMEPADGDEHYTEQLVRLPGIGVCFRKPVIPRALVNSARGRFGLRNDSIVYLCCQSPYKYLPVHDDIFVRIAQQVPSAQFLFLRFNQGVGKTFHSRLGRAFAAAGLDASDHCVFLPGADPIDYWGINLTSDVFLDSLEWSGFNTSMEAVACGLPIVTLPGRFMRGRHTFAILTQLGVPETIARDKDDYVGIAVRLGMDKPLRQALARKMAENDSSLYSDNRSVIVLEQFLRSKVQAGPREHLSSKSH
jgi:predicted O-linked N-acetylglucosamine transferase (SPINDLY family)